MLKGRHGQNVRLRGKRLHADLKPQRASSSRTTYDHHQCKVKRQQTMVKNVIGSSRRRQRPASTTKTPSASGAPLRYLGYGRLRQASRQGGRERSITALKTNGSAPTSVIETGQAFRRHEDRRPAKLSSMTFTAEEVAHRLRQYCKV